MFDLSKISPYAIVLTLNGRFSEPFVSKKTNKYYSNFIFDGGKFLIEIPPDVTPGVRYRATFEAEFSILNDSRGTHSVFSPAKALAFEPLK